MPEAYASFPGLDIRSADMVFSVGVLPSVCHVVAIPNNISGQIGNLVLSDGDTAVTLQDCAIDYAYSTQQKVRKGTRVQLRILDRRWRWAFAEINGRYNIRDSRGDYIPASQKTWEELFGLLLDATGETGYSVDANILSEAPSVDWDGVSLIAALDRLCELSGCYITLGIDNVIRVISKASGSWPVGTGTEMHDDSAVSRSAIPKSIRVLFEPTIHQTRLLLEPVAEDWDGTIRPIVDMGVAWQYTYPGAMPFIFSRMTTRDYWRMYRIKDINSEGGTPPPPGPGPSTPGNGGSISTASGEIILQDKLAVHTFDGTSRPHIMGTFWAGGLTEATVSTSSLYYKNRQFAPPMTIDFDKGFVWFETPMLAVDSTSGWLKDPEISLYAAYNKRDQTTGGVERYSADIVVPGSIDTTDSVKIIHAVDRFRIICDEYDGKGDYTSTTDNASDLDTVANDLADSWLNGLSDPNNGAMEWDGIVATSPSGVMPQVRWILKDSVRTVGYRNEFGPDSKSSSQQYATLVSERTVA